VTKVLVSTSGGGELGLETRS